MLEIMLVFLSQKEYQNDKCTLETTRGVEKKGETPLLDQVK